jgi:hypothetical protein
MPYMPHHRPKPTPLTEVYVDPDGRLWRGDMGRLRRQADERIYRLNPDARQRSTMRLIESRLSRLLEKKERRRQDDLDLTEVNQQIAGLRESLASIQQQVKENGMRDAVTAAIKKAAARRAEVGAKVKAAKAKMADESLADEQRAYWGRQAGELERHYRDVESRGLAEINLARAKVAQDLERQRTSGPALDALGEAKRQREITEVADLASQWKGQPKQVIANNLIAPAQRAFQVGSLDRARVLLDAATRAGAPDPVLEQRLFAAEMQADPKRKAIHDEEAALEREAQHATVATWIDRVTFEVGSGPERAALSGRAEFALKARMGADVPPEGGVPE